MDAVQGPRAPADRDVPFGQLLEDLQGFGAEDRNAEPDHHLARQQRLNLWLEASGVALRMAYVDQSWVIILVCLMFGRWSPERWQLVSELVDP